MEKATWVRQQKPFILLIRDWRPSWEMEKICNAQPISRLAVEAVISNRVFKMDKTQKELDFSIEYNLESGVRNAFL